MIIYLISHVILYDERDEIICETLIIYHFRSLKGLLCRSHSDRDALRSIVVYSFMSRLRLEGNTGYIRKLRSLPEMLKRNGTSHLNVDERRRILGGIKSTNRR